MLPASPSGLICHHPHLTLNPCSSLTKLPVPQTGHAFLLPPGFAKCCCFCLEHSSLQPPVNYLALQPQHRHLFLQEAFPGAPHPVWVRHPSGVFQLISEVLYLRLSDGLTMTCKSICLSHWNEVPPSSDRACLSHCPISSIEHSVGHIDDGP